MNFEGEGEIKIDGEDYNVKIIVSKKESPKDNGLVHNVLSFLNKTFSIVKTESEKGEKSEKSTDTQDLLNVFVMEKIKEYIQDEPTQKIAMMFHQALLDHTKNSK